MLPWFSGGESTVEVLIAQKKYEKAIELLQAQLRDRPRNVRLRLQMGDVLALAQRVEAAVKVLLELVEEFVADGFIPKAIAVLKKIQRIEPGRAGVDERLAELARARGEEAEVRRSGAREPIAAPMLPPTTSAAGASLRSPLFGDFSREELLAVIRGLRLLTYEPGEIIMTEGEPGASLLVLTTGIVRVFVVNAVGRNMQVRTMEEGEFFGEISLLTGNPRTATVTAATPCELLELDRSALDEISRAHPRVMEVVRQFHDRRAGSIDESMARSI